MREILFRGKQISDGEWVEGYLGIEVNNSPVIQWCEFDENYGVDCVEESAVIPETVGQYTGLKDKNGRKVFEGDILSGYLDDLFPEEESRYEVIWHDYGWHIRSNGLLDTPDNGWLKENFEVIGNIYDNPELLKTE